MDAAVFVSRNMPVARKWKQRLLLAVILPGCVLTACHKHQTAPNAGAPPPQTPKESGHDEPPPLINVPIPAGQSAQGVRFPYFDDSGKLKMFFNVDVMLRKDNGHLQMTNAKIETYGDDGKPEMTVSLPLSLLDLNTRVLTSDRPFTLRRSDFELSGDTLELNTVTRMGKIAGKIKMIIYNNLGEATKTESPHE